ncbi:hypothetical protein SEA_JAMS_69 [Gordonia phage Jams]|uniref:Uncharacterized protein n=1 Tax=Gordonia phage Newt TaxID=2591191 RepID=A0A514A648_9CAUD|nr:hypothetical protein SEA_NEWT_70 [Gordonia phage Newt]UXE04951.1 hypothetical protein SEA_JAMS_69 [Gordonia phage Jams]WAA19603.1 hypothetical protein SEA_GALACTICEYE_69 [Gordonia phage GalacticEye]
MAKKGPELCMFCEAAPCECEGVAKPKAKKKAAAGSRRAKKAGKVAPAQATAAQEAGETVPEKDEATEPVARAVEPVQSELWGSAGQGKSRRRRRKIPQSSIPEARAIRVFADLGMLSRDELRRHADKINPPLSGSLTKYIEGRDEHVCDWPEESTGPA